MSLVHNFVACGVPLFLFVGGGLCAKSSIKNTKLWIWRKVIRILVPYYIILLPILIFYLIQNENLVSISQFFILIFDLQGLQNFFIINFDFYTAPQGLGHLWYVTIVLIGYLLIAFLERYTKGKKSIILLLIIVSFILQPFLCLVHIQSIYLFTFVLGYVYVKNCKLPIKTQLVFTTFLFVGSTGVRLLFRHKYDGTIFYDYVIAPYHLVFTAIWIFVLIFFLRNQWPKQIDNIGKSPVALFVDSIIYEIYLIHSVTLAGKYSVYSITQSLVLANCVSLVLTVILAVIVNRGSAQIKAKLLRFGLSEKR